MPPPTGPNDSLPWSDPADGIIDYDAISQDLDVDVDPSHNGLYDLFQSSTEPQSKGNAREVLQPVHGLPSALSPTASDPDSASDSSRSTTAMNNMDVNDVTMNGYFDFDNEPGVDWGDLTVFNNDVNDTINPAVIDQPMSMHMDLVDVTSAPSHASSSPSDINASPAALHDHDDYIPSLDRMPSSQNSPAHMQSPLSQNRAFMRKRLSVRDNLSFSRVHPSSITDLKLELFYGQIHEWLTFRRLQGCFPYLPYGLQSRLFAIHLNRGYYSRPQPPVTGQPTGR